MAGAVNPVEFLDPWVLTAAFGDLATPNGWETLFNDLSSIASDGLAVPDADQAAATDTAGDAGAAASATDPTTAFWQGLEQDWINSSFGKQVDSSLNAYMAQADPAADPTGGACGLICNGADGTGGGSLTAADGQGGGIFFGNGGNGATDAAGQGGDGGNADFFGNGGNGGVGADGGDGGNGGNGG